MTSFAFPSTISTAVMHTERPMSSTERAKMYAQELRRRSTTPPTASTSPMCSVDMSMGELGRLREHCEGLDERLGKMWDEAHDRCHDNDRTVGDILDYTKAYTGRLYDLRAQLEEL